MSITDCTLSRRTFLSNSALLVASSCTNPNPPFGSNHDHDTIQTVSGLIEPQEADFVLPHEHVLVDFIGAKKASKSRYDVDQAFGRILPYLREAKSSGIQTIAECTPAYLGRDVQLLSRLASASDINFITNTGYYAARNGLYLPEHAFNETAMQLANRWIREARYGIDGTQILPGFIKIAVGNAPLLAIDKKIVEAAIITHKETGLAIITHIGAGKITAPRANAGLEILKIIKRENMPGERFVWAHAHATVYQSALRQAADSGVNLAFEGLTSEEAATRNAKLVARLYSQHFGKQLLISNDGGWYHVGKPDGGKFKPYTNLIKWLLPKLTAEGLNDKQIKQLTHINPKQIFSI